jgi:hypothetical protein
VGHQWLGQYGKTDDGVVTVTTVWADERLYYPVHAVPYTPARHFAKGKNDPAFRTKLAIGADLAAKARDAGFVPSPRHPVSRRAPRRRHALTSLDWRVTRPVRLLNHLPWSVLLLLTPRSVLCQPDLRYLQALTCGASSSMAAPLL